MDTHSADGDRSVPAASTFLLQEQAEEFLADYEGHVLPWSKPAGAPTVLETDRVLFGTGENPFEVALAYATSDGQRPKAEDVRALWKKRHASRPSPVLLVVLYREAPANAPRAWVIGTSGDPAPTPDLPVTQVARVAAAALDQPDRHAASRTVERLLAGLTDNLTPGLVNSGLFASHELRTGVPQRGDWHAAQTAAQPLLGLQGQRLLQELGYGTAPRGSAAMLLTQGQSSRAIAVLLDETELFDRPSSRFGAVSPIAHGLTLAEREGLPWLVVLRGTQIRLYPAASTVGVGQKGQAETYTELDLALLADEDAAYLSLLFSPDALASGGSVEQILATSRDFAADLGKRLRERIYDDVVPDLALAVAARRPTSTDEELTETYHQSLLILFRLLFLAYAEDRGLLPYGRNPRYDRHAIKTLARDFTAEPKQAFDAQATSLWEGMQTVWNAVDEGNTGWDVPAYNGGLFSRDPDTNPSGAALAELQLTDAEFGPALQALLVDTGEDGTHGPVDFRSLSVREFGTIYEGLLESSLSIAPADLTVNTNGAYVPASTSDQVDVSAGRVYIHHKSGTRKSTGSYFTKRFAVEHLLNTALEPALDAHLDRITQLVEDGDDAAAGQAFFDFRVADLAMGSAHFLVAAIDRIEARFTAFLTEHPIPTVTDELTRLAQTARDALGDQGSEVELETGMLLRRQIARRCIYGLDLNLMAVELARLAVWIHTFVPGLPMSALNHGLVHGNSLTGIATLDEVLDVLDPRRKPGHASLFAPQIETALETAHNHLQRVAATAEATKQEVRDAAHAHTEALHQARDAQLLCDAAVAIRLGLIKQPLDPQTAIDAASSQQVQDKVRELQVMHFPVRFPEVFLRDRPGFDVLLGNPPWDKVRHEPQQFWVTVSPGLNTLSPSKREEKIKELRSTHPVEAGREQAEIDERQRFQSLVERSYRLRGGTHYDLANLMMERVLTLLRTEGNFGLVLPRQSMVLAGWSRLREAILRDRTVRVVQARNDREWIFEDIEARYMVAFLSAGPSHKDPQVLVWPAVTSPTEVAAATSDTAIVFSAEDISTSSTTYVIPWFTTGEDRRLFDQMRAHPRLSSADGWITAWHDARWDFRRSNKDNRLVTEQDETDAWRVLMTRHVDAYTIDEVNKFKQFITDFQSVVATGRGVEFRGRAPVLTEAHPLITLRHPSRNDDSRTLIATALPESGLLHNKGYAHAIAHAPDAEDNAKLALLGAINSLTLDWWARRFVDRHVTAPVINLLPLPNWDEHTIQTVATSVGTLLARHGYTRLAGGVAVSDTHAHTSDVALRAHVDVLTACGFGLTRQDMYSVLADFNDTGCPPELHGAILNGESW